MRARLAYHAAVPGADFAGRDMVEIVELDRRIGEMVKADRELDSARFEALCKLLAQGFSAIVRSG